MSYDTMSAIENEPSNTSDTNTSDATGATIPSVSRRVELLRMSLRTLRALLETTGLSLDLTNRLSPQILGNLDSELVIMATMDTGEWPREPPPVEERRTLTAVADTSVLASQDAFIASNLEPNQVRQGEVTTRFVLTAEDIALLKTERVRLASRLTSNTTVAGLVAQYIGSAFSIGMVAPELGRADQRTGSSHKVRRSRGARPALTGSHWDKGTQVASADGFNQPPDVG